MAYPQTFANISLKRYDFFHKKSKKIVMLESHIYAKERRKKIFFGHKIVSDVKYFD